MNVKIREFLSAIKRKVYLFRNKKNLAGKVKYFCIGRNKTGTTSLQNAFESLNFVVGNQRQAEILYDKYYFKGDFDPIIKYCETAQVFQDVPFSCPDTFKYLDKAYPGSKFILTIRDDENVWYRSITNFHAKMFGLNGRVPTVSDLKNASYVRKGFLYNTIKLHGTSDEDPYNKETMIAHYNRYNSEVMEYFKDRPQDLLVINLTDKDAYTKFVDFIGVKSEKKHFPWKNKT